MRSSSTPTSIVLLQWPTSTTVFPSNSNTLLMCATGALPAFVELVFSILTMRP